MTVTDTINGILGHLPAWIAAATAVVSAASAIAALTPTPKDDELAGKLYRIVDVLALNVLHAKEPAEPDPKRPANGEG